MHSLAYQHNTGIHPGAVINRAQPKAAPDHEKIRDAVRAWSSALDNQDVVSALIINEYREQGGTAISFPEDISRARQKLFRFLDNRFDSEQYRENVRQLTPAIMAVLPLEYRHRLLPEDSFMSRLARLEKETSEAKVAVAMNAPRHQKIKELSEGIVEMFRVDPDLTAPLMAMVTSMLGVM
ncbi:toxin YdaT domain-containing protein [Citrobacter freundii]|uniref:toxin YdaT domain-containing protein n=1 Tax=Citrobacter freundii TaxID=546 RepID=UPI002876FA66|nr:toxin YdaT domain-containing protein [Citrobacter freundii]MDS0990935.1 toxin YdaT domain-containing protein [Citrobacter freundii]